MQLTGSAAVAGPLEPLVARAFASGPAQQANQLISDVRQQVQAEEGRAFNYEVALIGRSWEYLRQTVAPRLALYLRGKRLGLADSRCVFISLFVEKTIYFIRASDFFSHLRQVEGVDEQAFAEMLRVWEQTGCRSAGALPPYGEENGN